jgi:hypothetical protein
VTTSSDAQSADQMSDEHEHRPKRDTWLSIASNLPADLFDMTEYPVTAVCDTCHLQIYGRSFASDWLLSQDYEILHGPIEKPAA